MQPPIHGFHLFLEPPPELSADLRMAIGRLAEEYGGPVFVPHITLLSRIDCDEAEAINRTRKLADTLTPLTISLRNLDARDEYFRALYILIPEKEQLTPWHRQAAELFEMEDPREYLPHLSLLYGEYPEERKRRTMETLDIPAVSFLVDRICLYRTEGAPEEWEKVEEFHLKG